MVDTTEALAGVLPVPGNCFRVAINGKEIGISSVTPPTLADDARLGPDKTPDTITLRRAVGRSRNLFEWRRAVAQGKNDRRDVTVELLQGPGGEALAVWRFIGCTPLRWQGPALDGLSPALAYEEIELAYKDLEWVGR
jgi:phage tail-like protein